MTREEAAEKLLLKFDFIPDNLKAFDILAFIESYEDGLGMYPPMNKKGKFEWSSKKEDSQEQTGTK